MESVASLAWNWWQLSYGIGGNFRTEYALSLNLLAFLFHTVLEWSDLKYVLLR